MNPCSILNNFIFYNILLVLVTNEISGKKEKEIIKVPCPDEDDTVCVKCNCDESTGFNACKPMKYCPKPVTLSSKIRKKEKQARCPYGKSLVAQCTLCECSGDGSGDHCAICYALPVRRIGQPEEVNTRLLQVTDNRIFNYEITGWVLPEIDRKK